MTPEGGLRRRYRWRCPVCKARGTAPTPDAARDAGVAHYLDHHDERNR